MSPEASTGLSNVGGKGRAPDFKDVMDFKVPDFKSYFLQLSEL